MLRQRQIEWDLEVSLGVLSGVVLFDNSVGDVVEWCGYGT